MNKEKATSIIDEVIKSIEGKTKKCPLCGEKTTFTDLNPVGAGLYNGTPVYSFVTTCSQCGKQITVVQGRKRPQNMQA